MGRIRRIKSTKRKNKNNRKSKRGSICIPLIWFQQYMRKQRTLILSSDTKVLVKGRSANIENVDFEFSPKNTGQSFLSLTFYVWFLL